MQLSLFSQFSDAEQIMMLEETLRELEYGREYFDNMLSYWRHGDEAGIQGLFDEGVMQQEGSDRFYKLIMTDRNHTMIQKLIAMAKQGGSYFVVVGAGHLVGDEGIISMLKQHGYEVEQL